MRLSLVELDVHFRQMFGARNAAFLDGLSIRFIFLVSAISKLQKAVRKGDRPLMERRLAGSVAWLFGFMGHFPPEFGSIFNAAMAKKWGSPVCRYCNQPTCCCAFAHRPDPDLNIDMSGNQALTWTLSDYQGNIARIYGAVNKPRGSEGALNRLLEELGELARVLPEGLGSNWSANELMARYAGEAIDLLAWLLSLADLLGFDLGDCVGKYYGQFCPGCQHVICIVLLS